MEQQAQLWHNRWAYGRGTRACSIDNATGTMACCIKPSAEWICLVKWCTAGCHHGLLSAGLRLAGPGWAGLGQLGSAYRTEHTTYKQTVQAEFNALTHNFFGLMDTFTAVPSISCISSATQPACAHALQVCPTQAQVLQSHPHRLRVEQVQPDALRHGEPATQGGAGLQVQHLLP